MQADKYVKDVVKAHKKYDAIQLYVQGNIFILDSEMWLVGNKRSSFNTY